MNDLELLAKALRDEFPSARFEVAGTASSTWLDIEHASRSVAVEWRPGIGFGVSVIPDQEQEPLSGLFEGPDEVFERWPDARDYVISLIKDASHKLRKVVAR
jgi:hypothetical protein